MLIAWVVILSSAIICAAFPFAALSKPVPILVAFTLENSDLLSNRVLALAPGAAGVLFVGTDGGGLARVDKDGRWQTYTAASTKGGLPDDRVTALAPGVDDALWIGTEGGLARLDKGGRWQTYTAASTKGGLPHDEVRALALGVDGALWIGTIGGGVARVDKDGRWQTYSTVSTKGGLPSHFDAQGSLPFDDVRALVPGTNGALWVGTVVGLARLDKDGRWQAYSLASAKPGWAKDSWPVPWTPNRCRVPRKDGQRCRCTVSSTSASRPGVPSGTTNW